jgi:hypothetical protein
VVGAFALDRDRRGDGEQHARRHDYQQYDRSTTSATAASVSAPKPNYQTPDRAAVLHTLRLREAAAQQSTEQAERQLGDLLRGVTL